MVGRPHIPPHRLNEYAKRRSPQGTRESVLPNVPLDAPHSVFERDEQATALPESCQLGLLYRTRRFHAVDMSEDAT